MKLSVVMPVYNERINIRKIIQKVLAVNLDKELVIVDDGSSDGTAEELKTIKGIKLILHETNYGKGKSIQTGIRNASGDWIIIQDADLEYEPADYSRMLEPILNKKAEVVYGSRFLGKCIRSFSPLQLFANLFLTFLTNLLFGSRLTDMETCYKMVPRGLMVDLDLESSGFEIEAEITAKILKRRIYIVEVPVSYFGRSYKAGKKIRAKDGFLTLFALFKYRLRLSQSPRVRH